METLRSWQTIYFSLSEERIVWPYPESNYRSHYLIL